MSRMLFCSACESVLVPEVLAGNPARIVYRCDNVDQVQRHKKSGRVSIQTEGTHVVLVRRRLRRWGAPENVQICKVQATEPRNPDLEGWYAFNSGNPCFAKAIVTIPRPDTFVWNTRIYAQQAVTLKHPDDQGYDGPMFPADGTVTQVDDTLVIDVDLRAWKPWIRELAVDERTGCLKLPNYQILRGDEVLYPRDGEEPRAALIDIMWKLELPLTLQHELNPNTEAMVEIFTAQGCPLAAMQEKDSSNAIVPAADPSITESSSYVMNRVDVSKESTSGLGVFSADLIHDPTMQRSTETECAARCGSQRAIMFMSNSKVPGEEMGLVFICQDCKCKWMAKTTPCPRCKVASPAEVGGDVEGEEKTGEQDASKMCSIMFVEDAVGASARFRCKTCDHVWDL